MFKSQTLTNACAPFFEESPFFPCAAIPLQPLYTPQAWGMPFLDQTGEMKRSQKGVRSGKERSMSEFPQEKGKEWLIRSSVEIFGGFGGNAGFPRKSGNWVVWSALPSREAVVLLKFRRVTIRGAQPSARLSEGNLPLRGLCGGLSEGSAGSLRGFCGALRGSVGFSEVFGGSDPMLVTLENCEATNLLQAPKPRKIKIRKK